MPQNRNSATGAQGAAAGAAYNNRNSSQYSGKQGAAAGAAYNNRNSPQYSGAQGAAAGAAASNRNNPQYSGAQGAAAGYAAGQNRSGAGFGNATASQRYNAASTVRGNYSDYGAYGKGWYADHPNAWAAAGWDARRVWTPATWTAAGAWCGFHSAAPVYYNYGSNVTYQGDNVYVDGQDAGTSAQYYQGAQTLASAGSDAAAPADSSDWMPLGVFAFSRNAQTASNVTIQLAVNKQGIIRGNYTDTDTHKTQLIQGSVDKATQRVAFTVGDNTTNIVETGLYNLTKDEAPALIHFGQDRTEQWLLVRLKQPDATASNN